LPLVRGVSYISIVSLVWINLPKNMLNIILSGQNDLMIHGYAVALECGKRPEFGLEIASRHK
jgi:hypothetical protein